MRMRYLLVLAIGIFIGSPIRASEAAKIKAIAFDGLTIFDPSPLWVEAERQFPEQGKELATLWRSRLFEYQWLRASGNRYKNFQDVTRDALIFAAKSQKLDLTPDKEKALLAPLLQLKAYPDAKPALQALKAAGFRLAFLSNMTPTMLQAGIKNSGLEGLFDESLSTDRIRTYKPDPKAYQLGLDALHLKLNEILFVPFAGWDLSGALWFGYPTFWINRASAPAEELDATPLGSGKNLSDLCHYLGINS
jgi:2-haloacid dehalogenase